DPMRDDDALGYVVEAAQAQAGPALDVFAAAEGMTVDVTPSAVPRAPAAKAPITARTSVPEEMLDQTVLLALDQPDLRERLMEAVMADGLKLATAPDTDAVLKPSPDGAPSLLMLGSRLGGRDGLEVARAVRNGGEVGDKDLPIVLVAANEAEADRAAGAAAGVTDWLVAPFSMLYARTRGRCARPAAGSPPPRRPTRSSACARCTSAASSTRRRRSASTASRGWPAGCSTCPPRW